MRNYKITNTLQGKNIVYRLKLIRVANVANEVAKPKHKFQTKLHTGSKSSKSSNIFWGLKKKMNLMEKIIGEIEMETKLKMKIIPRSTSEALKFFRQVRFLPDFDPDRARVSSVRRKVTKNHRNFTIERPLNIDNFLFSIQNRKSQNLNNIFWSYNTTFWSLNTVL
jgi:hypothetical protein